MQLSWPCLICLFIPCHMIVAGYYSFMLDVHVSYHQSICCTSVSVSFLDDNLIKCQWIFTKLDVYIGIVETWFGIANDQILSSFDWSACYPSIFLFPDDNLRKCQWIFTKLGMCIDIVEILFWTANGQILSIYDRVIYPTQVRILISRQ